MKKISIVGTVGLPAKYGGFETLVENLTKNNNNVTFNVYCSSFSYLKKKPHHNGAKLIFIPIKANGWQSVLYDIYSLLHSFFSKTDTVLILGISGCIFLPIFKIVSNISVVTNIDGIEWKRKKWGWFARRFLKFSEYCAVKYSDKVITDNSAITEYVLHDYGIISYTIAYGGDHALDKKVKTLVSDYALTICRIEPENNIEMILKAFSIIKHKIIIVGNWSNSNYGKNLRNKFKNFQNISMLDPIYENFKLASLRMSCKLYVHGHSVGGTNPSLVEIMHFSKPVLCFDCIYNRATTNNQAAYFASVDTLISKLNRNDFSAMGEKLKYIADKNYTWSIIRKKYMKIL